jgi:hypothetical protein
MNIFDGAGWGGWRTMGGATDVSPAAASMNGRVYLFAKSLDAHIYMRVIG